MVEEMSSFRGTMIEKVAVELSGNKEPTNEDIATTAAFFDEQHEKYLARGFDEVAAGLAVSNEIKQALIYFTDKQRVIQSELETDAKLKDIEIVLGGDREMSLPD